MILRELHNILTEASYEGNIGIAEITKFFMVASPEQKKKFKELSSSNKKKLTWDLVYQVIGGPKLKKVH
jgi:hypothetical protein